MTINPIVNSDNGRSDLFSMNLENGIVILSGEIDDDMAASVVSQLLYLEKNYDGIISMYINSPGGSVSAGLAIYSTMRYLMTHGKVIETVCIGRAASMAAVILSGGTRGRRSAFLNSDVMIHQPSGGIGGVTEDVIITANHMSDIRERVNGILAENCDKTEDEILTATVRDCWLDSVQALHFGIIDQIIGDGSKNIEWITKAV
ncbi:MAG: ATP-dependent Clp protease proteolytic subunit [Lachnospiraceae bacterium]|nr:ATP-dependent Clp protease proteolytic subunit [Lachnospiraceae bacterium]